MGFSQFFEAIFVVADLHCGQGRGVEVEAEQYTAFIRVRTMPYPHMPQASDDVR